MLQSRAKLVLDTNLLLLWLAGTVDISLLKTFKRVQDFTPADYRILRSTIQQYPSLGTTPHILAETSNFLRQAPPHRQDELVSALARFIETVTEQLVPALDLIRWPEFTKLGLTDTALMEFAATATVITLDFRLCGRIQARGGSFINFNHLRSA